VRVTGADVGVTGAGIVQIAVPFIWLGMVLVISFLETPLKSRAPGITVPPGLGIGRLVFRALAVVELALAGVLTAALVLGDRNRCHRPGRPVAGGPGGPGGVWLPRLDRHARLILAGRSLRRSRLHLAYGALDGIKVVLLPVLGVVLVTGTAS
jgi:hypothetical protein